GVEPIHVKILRRPDGSYVLQDNASREGTLLNGARLQAPAVLKGGDVIQFGVNVVRFNERFKRAGAADQLPLPTPAAAAPPARAPEPVVVGVRAGTPAAAIMPAVRPAPVPA